MKRSHGTEYGATQNLVTSLRHGNMETAHDYVKSRGALGTKLVVAIELADS